MTRRLYYLKRRVMTPWTPAQLPGLQLWLDAGQLALADGDPVAAWTDQSDRHNDAVQPNPGAQPVYRTTAAHGRPALAFDGATTRMATTAPVVTRSLVLVLNHTDGAMFTAYRRILDGGDRAGWSLFGVGSTTHYTPDADYSRGIAAADMRVNGQITTAAAPLDRFRVIAAQTAQEWTTTVWLGTYAGTGAQVLRGHLAEVLISSDPLGDADRVKVEQYLMRKYGIA